MDQNGPKIDIKENFLFLISLFSKIYILLVFPLAENFCISCYCLNYKAFFCFLKSIRFPPPTTLAGRKVWIVGKVRDWITDAANRKETEALKEAKRLRVFM